MLLWGGLLVLSRQAAAASANFRLWGVNYGIRDGPDWLNAENGRCKSFDRVVSELQRLLDLNITHRVRVFSVTDCDTAFTVLQAAEQVVNGDLSVWLGLWASNDTAVFEWERARFLELLAVPNSMDRVIGVHVTSEAIYREEITVSQAVAMRDTIKADLVNAGLTSIPVTVADIIDTNLAHPELIAVDDGVVTFNQFPFWERTTNINDAAAYMGARVDLLENQAGGRQIVVTETGWADAGANDAANPANAAAQQKWLRDFVCLARSRNWHYFWFNAYDSDWRRVNEQSPDDVEGHFGLFDDDGNLKPHVASVLNDLDCAEPAYDIDPNDGATLRPAVEAVSEPTATPDGEDPEPTADNGGDENEIPFSTVEPEDRNGTTTAAPAQPEDDPTAANPSNATETVSSPTLAPVNLTLPTASPVNNDTDSPSAAPVEAVEPTTNPVSNETAAPSWGPSQSPALSTPSSSNNNETSSPSPAPASSSSNATAAPTGAPPPELCSANPECPILPGTEACCPTRTNRLLACCENSGGGVVAACSGNPKCLALAIPGFCCPTNDARYLDCCRVLPDDCVYENSNDGACNIYNAVRYKLDLDEAQEASLAAHSPRLTSTSSTTILLSLLGVATLIFL